MKLLDVENWTQKKLKLMHIVFLCVYGLLAFVGPIVGAIIMTSSTGQIEQKWKAPVIVVVIIIAVLLSAIFFLKKSVAKIKVLNLDGSYNQKMLVTKLVLSFLCAAAIPIGILCGVSAVRVWLIDKVNFYMDLTILVVSFSVASKFVNEIFLQHIEIELDIRDKVSEANAVQRRVNNLTNINK